MGPIMHGSSMSNSAMNQSKLTGPVAYPLTLYCAVRELNWCASFLRRTNHGKHCIDLSSGASSK
jgi:hypothetical protein